MQVSSDTGVMLVAPFAGGKTGLMRELKKLYNASGGIKVRVKRGSSVVDVRAKVAVDESSLLKKTYVLASANDNSHVATLVDAMEQDCLLLQGAPPAIALLLRNSYWLFSSSSFAKAQVLPHCKFSCIALPFKNHFRGGYRQFICDLNSPAELFH